MIQNRNLKPLAIEIKYAIAVTHGVVFDPSRRACSGVSA